MKPILFALIFVGVAWTVPFLVATKQPWLAGIAVFGVALTAAGIGLELDRRRNKF